MLRRIFNNEHWSKLKAILLDHGIYDKPNLRQTAEGMFYRIRVGCPWSDPPERFEPWNKIYKRFRAWRARARHAGDRHKFPLRFPAPILAVSGIAARPLIAVFVTSPFPGAHIMEGYVLNFARPETSGPDGT